MNNYDKDVLSFDVVDPLQFIGIDATRKRLEEWFSTFQGPIENEINDLKIELSGDVAFCSRPSGIVKIMGERFTALPVNHPFGHYLEALHLTGYYYTFIGVLQVTTAILLLIPRTALLGALIYFPMILNICILAYGSINKPFFYMRSDLVILYWNARMDV